MARFPDIQHRIRDDILSGQLAFGVRITTADLAVRYGVSQMPIRMALRELRGEGLVTMEPNRGARVRSIDPEFIGNIFDIRNALEVLVVRRAARLRTTQHIAQLQSLDVKRTKVDTFVLVKLFPQLPRAEATEENPFKSMAHHLIEVKVFSSVGNKPNLADMTSRLHSRSCVAPLKKVLGISKLPKSWGTRQSMRDNNFTSTSTTIATLLQLELK
jgi:DNA-binding transcriptional regulator YhcF (GntR family)